MSSERGWRGAAGYLDLDVRIGQASGGAYLVEADSSAGEASETTRFSDGLAALEGRLQALRTVLRGAHEPTAPERQVLPAPVALAPEGEPAVRAFGQQLFEALMPPPVRGVYERSRQAADDQGQSLRLRLRIRDPRLAALPWEFLYDPHRRAYLCWSRRTSVVRRVESPRPVPPTLRVAPPLRVLGMAALPPDQDRLDAAGERAWVEAALTPLTGQHEAELRWVEGQTWRALQQSLRQGPWHVFHFVGHGGLDPRTGAGYLALVDEHGGPYRLSAADLAGLIGELDELRLVVLNTCLGARGTEQDVFSSVAAQLVHTGVPAVVAMQYEISDTAATEFARTFYAAVVGPQPRTAAGERRPLAVDAAVAEAREAMRLAAPQTLEWATPVLYLRAPDAVLFDLQPQSAQAPPVRRGRTAVPARVLLVGAALTLVAIAAYLAPLLLGANQPPAATAPAAPLLTNDDVIRHVLSSMDVARFRLEHERISERKQLGRSPLRLERLVPVYADGQNAAWEFWIRNDAFRVERVTHVAVAIQQPTPSGGTCTPGGDVRTFSLDIRENKDNVHSYSFDNQQYFRLLWAVLQQEPVGELVPRWTTRKIRVVLPRGGASLNGWPQVDAFVGTATPRLAERVAAAQPRAPEQRPRASAPTFDAFFFDADQRVLRSGPL